MDYRESCRRLSLALATGRAVDAAEVRALIDDLYARGMYRALDRTCRSLLVAAPFVGMAYEMLSRCRVSSDFGSGDGYAWRWRRHCMVDRRVVDDGLVAALQASDMPPAEKAARLSGLAAWQPAALLEVLSARLRQGECCWAGEYRDHPDERVRRLAMLAERVKRGDDTVDLTVHGRAFRYWLSGNCPDLDVQIAASGGGAFSPGWLSHLAVLGRVAKPGMSVVDVGANVGFVTTFLASCGAKVLAIEPNPATAAVLRRHVEWNAAGLPVEVGEYAVGREAGTSRLVSGYETLGARLSSTGVEVPVRRLDDVVDGPVDFIKVDVEGNEIDVLLGAVRLLREARPLLFVEAWPRHKRRLVAFLAAFEYRVAADLPQDLLMVPDERL